MVEARKEPKKGNYLDEWNSTISDGRLRFLSPEKLERLKGIYSSIRDFDEERKLIEEARRSYWDRKPSSKGEAAELRFEWRNKQITYENNAYELIKKIEELLDDNGFWD